MTKEEQQQAYYQANVRLTLLYALPDICEALLKDMEDYQKKAGTTLRYEQKMYWKAFLKSSYNLRKVVKPASEAYRISYANVCDLLQTLFLSVIDRCDDVEGIDILNNIISYIQSFPSKRNIEIK